MKELIERLKRDIGGDRLLIADVLQSLRPGDEIGEMVVVRKEPTEAMLRSGSSAGVEMDYYEIHSVDLKSAWSAMIAAAKED